MEDRKELYKNFEGKPVLIITNSDFKYHTNNLKCLDDSISFTDKFGKLIIISYYEIKMIVEEREWNQKK